jgi:pimeloyl-ACP methyl ester carboxylesterase
MLIITLLRRSFINGLFVRELVTLQNQTLICMFQLFRNGRIHYSDSGTGPVIVLLHGYLESSESWNGFEEKLALAFRVISMDLPGHGLSDCFGETHSMEFMASVVKELLDNLGIKKSFLTGHSLGGYVTLAFLELFPDYLSGYCLFHSQPFADSTETLEKRTREIAIVKAGKKHLMYPGNVMRMFAPSNLEMYSEALQRLKTIASKIPGEGIISVLKGMMCRPTRLNIMEEGKVPCLWILGSMDNYIPYDIILTKVNLPANARVVILNNSGHLGFIEEEDLSIRLISDFVNNLLKL